MSCRCCRGWDHASCAPLPLFLGGTSLHIHSVRLLCAVYTQALLVLRNAAPEFELSLPRFLAHLAGKLPCQEFRLEERLPNVCGTIYIYKGERNSKFGVLPTFTMSILPILVSQSRLEKGVDEEEKGTRVILIRTRPRRGVEVKAAFLFRGSCWGERRRESQLKNERR